MTSALFQIQVNGGGYGAAGVHAIAPAGATIDCRIASMSGINPGLISWRIAGTHAAAAAAPAITLSGAPTGQIASFTLPAGLGQAYGIECLTMGGESVSGSSADTALSAVYVLDVAGRAPYFIGETFERNSTHATVEALNAISSGTFSGGLSTPRNIAFADSPYAVALTDHVLLVDTTGGPVVINLPAISDGRELRVADSGNAGVSNVTINAGGGDTIAGAASLVLAAGYASTIIVGNASLSLWSTF